MRVMDSYSDTHLILILWLMLQLSDVHRLMPAQSQHNPAQCLYIMYNVIH